MNNRYDTKPANVRYYDPEEDGHLPDNEWEDTTPPDRKVYATTRPYRARIYDPATDTMMEASND